MASSEDRRTEHKVFCGGLSWTTSSSSLEHHFSRYGTVLNSYIMSDRATGKSRGFGFVSFDSEETLNSVINEPQHVIDGKVIDVKVSVDRDKAPKSIHKTAVEDDGREASQHDEFKLFVGALNPKSTNESLKSYMEELGGVGSVANAHIMADNKGSRGFGFVVFKNKRNMDMVLRKDHWKLDGRSIDVRVAVRRGQKDDKDGGNAYLLKSKQCPRGENPEHWKLAMDYGRQGWKAGYGTYAWAKHGWGLRGWEEPEGYQLSYF